MAEKKSDDNIEADLSMSLEEFVTKFTLPHFARVKEGVYDAYAQVSLEVANGELLELYRVVYPLTATLDFVSSKSGTKQTVSMSTMNDDLRFHVLTRNEKPFVYPTIAVVIKAWPLLVRCKTDDTNTSISVVDGNVLRRPAFRKNDELRLVRKTWDDEKRLVLECMVQGSTERLIQLPATDLGQFLELTDPTKSFTLQELIDVALVERRLEIDRSCKIKPVSLKGVPRDYGGTIHLSKPLVQVQIARLHQSEYNADITASDPFLVPIDCGIMLSPRDETYQQKPSVYKTYTLSSLVEKAPITYPYVVRVVSWTEPSAFLQNHLIRPGDTLVLYNRVSVDWILAHGQDRFLLIPATNRGKYVCTRSRSQLKLNLLEKQEFPISVQCFSDSDGTIEGEALSLDAFIKDEQCVLACKIFGDRAGTAFSLPLRTRIRVLPVEWRGERLPKTPTRFSAYDDSVESIPVKLYEEIMEHPRSRLKEETQGSVSPDKPLRTPQLQNKSSTVRTKSDATNHEESRTGPSITSARPNKKPPPPFPLPKERMKAAEPTSDNEYLTCKEVGVSNLSLSPQPSVDNGLNSQLQRSLARRKESNASRKEDWQPPYLTQDRTNDPKDSMPGSGTATVSYGELKKTARPRPSLPCYENTTITSGKRSQNANDLKFPSYENAAIKSGQRSRTTVDLKSTPYENCTIAGGTRSPNAIGLKPSAFQQKKKSNEEDVMIPEDGNIAHFTASELAQFLRQVKVPDDVIVTWHEQGITGKDFARLSDDALVKYGIDNTIIKFFRNGSRVRHTCLDRL